MTSKKKKEENLNWKGKKVDHFQKMSERMTRKYWKDEGRVDDVRDDESFIVIEKDGLLTDDEHVWHMDMKDSHSVIIDLNKMMIIFKTSRSETDK